MAKSYNHYSVSFLILLSFLLLRHADAKAIQAFQSDLSVDEASYLPEYPNADSILTDTTPLWGNTTFGPHLLPARDPMVPAERKSNHTGSIVLVWIIFGAFITGLARFLFPTRFKETLLAPLDSRFMTQLDREGGLMNNWVSFILFFNYLIGISLLLYQTGIQFGYREIFESINTVLLLIYGLVAGVVFYLFKYIVLFLTAWVFKTKNASESYFRFILMVNKLTGIILLPVLAVNFFNPSIWTLWFLWIFLIISGTYKITRVFPAGLSIPGTSPFHIILYLCTIEIAPLIFLLKIAAYYSSH